jgi:hypothetical protein
MPRVRVLAALAALVPGLPAQAIIAQTAGLPNPQHVIDFGANLYPNFTPITTQFTGITVTHARYFTNNFNNLVGGFLTNDPSGAPNTLRIVFGNPIRDLSFVYHQVGTTQPSVFRALLGPTVVDSFSNLSNQYQPNNYFGFTNIQFDELQIDFDVDFNIDTLAFNDAGATCRVRNGTGVNPLAFTCTTRPIQGQNWLSQIAGNANTLAAFIAFAPGGPHPGFPLLGGEVLVQINPAPVLVSGPGSFAVAIPTGSMWTGYQVATQGARLDDVNSTPTFVLLNALDLVLGQ